MKRTTTEDMQKKIADMLRAVTGYYVKADSYKVTCGEADGQDKLAHTLYNPVEVSDWSETQKYYVEYFPAQNTFIIYEFIPHQGYKIKTWVEADNLAQAQAVTKVVMVVDRIFR